MKHCFRLCTLLLALSLPALASTVDFSNQGGSLTGSNAGLTLSGSLLVGVSEPTIPLIVTGPNLGSVSFTTGALSSGSLTLGGMFAAGGTFDISTNGSNGLPNAMVFQGTFDTPVSWVLITLANGTHNYTLTGTLSGTWITGASVSGVTVQLTVNTGKSYFNGSTTLSSGNTDFSGSGVTTFGTVPEPSSILYIGTGLIAAAGIVGRRKLRVLKTPMAT